MVNKKQARKVALEIARALLEQEIRNPTNILAPEADTEDSFFTFDDKAAQEKVIEQLEIIVDQIVGKLARLA